MRHINPSCQYICPHKTICEHIFIFNVGYIYKYKIKTWFSFEYIKSLTPLVTHGVMCGHGSGWSWEFFDHLI
jgi:hypothetical protein